MGHSGDLSTVAISPDGQTLPSGNYDRTIKLWHLETGRELHTLTGHLHGVDSVAFSPDGKTLASGSDYEGIIKLWHLETGRELRTLTLSAEGCISVAFKLRWADSCWWLELRH